MEKNTKNELISGEKYEKMIHGGEIYDKAIEYDFSVNLNPNPCPLEVKEALIKAMEDVNRYPDISQIDFRTKVSESIKRYIYEDCKEFNLDGEMSENGTTSRYKDIVNFKNVLGGNGASELLMSLLRMINPKKALIISPSFSGYTHVLNTIKNCTVIKHMLTEEENFKLSDRILSDIDEALDVLILTNPNNPTGMSIDKSLFEKILKKCKEKQVSLIVDECFLLLSDNRSSAKKYIFDYEKMYVIDAYTKLFSIPGVRVGFVFSREENIERLSQYLPEWNMSVYALKAGEACAKKLIDSDFVEKSIEMIDKERAYITRKLKSFGLTVFESNTCFVLFRIDKCNSNLNLYEQMLEKKILIRDCKSFFEKERGYYRIAVKNHEENKALLNALESVLVKESMTSC